MQGLLLNNNFFSWGYGADTGEIELPDCIDLEYGPRSSRSMRTLQGLDLSRFFFAVLRCKLLSSSAWRQWIILQQLCSALLYNLVMALRRFSTTTFTTIMMALYVVNGYNGFNCMGGIGTRFQTCDVLPLWAWSIRGTKRCSCKSYHPRSIQLFRLKLRFRVTRCKSLLPLWRSSKSFFGRCLMSSNYPFVSIFLFSPPAFPPLHTVIVTTKWDTTYKGCSGTIYTQLLIKRVNVPRKQSFMWARDNQISTKK